MIRVLLGLVLVAVGTAVFTPKLADTGKATLISSYKQTHLYSIESPGYSSPYLLINVTGSSRHEMGYGWGYLLAKDIEGAYNALLGKIFKNKDERELIEVFLDIEYDLFLHSQIPMEYQQELEGIDAGSRAKGYNENIIRVKRGLVLSSFPGDVVKDIEWLIKDELYNNGTKISRQHMERLRAVVKKFNGKIPSFGDTKTMLRIGGQCSHFGVWGTRTTTGRLFSGRNLDWLGDSGIAVYKLVSVFHPPGNKYSHAAVGYAALYGALTGFSAKGITVHEAGDDNTRETFEGFAWVLRLRYIMENAQTMKEALNLWKATNNTLGINHGLGSAKDRVYTALETCAGYTAYFQDDDPREAASKYGAPLKEAIWRTNHAYDPTFLKTAMYSHPGEDTENRYMLLHDTFAYYGSAGVKIAALQAVNLTAVVGDKGGSKIPSFLTCAHARDGSNIISATFDPENQLMYLANEDGLGPKHSPACCNNYLKFDMSPWFAMPYN